MDILENFCELSCIVATGHRKLFSSHALKGKLGIVVGFIILKRRRGWAAVAVAAAQGKVDSMSLTCL